MTTAAINHQMRERHAHPHPASSPPPMAGGDQLADQLARLANLHSTGVLTAAEFAAAKARLLS
ncbi:SHOCT domain-containing protein [Arthrobacter flavus]|uniref:SHOCT domain-containing protein n=1 Tax=Arthrobacter flavus TaxID=95172 RepID=A0ABW4Q4P0_9MICC